MLPIEARPLAGLRLIAEPPPAPAAGASSATAASGARPGPLARAAALTADPHLRRAIERLFAHKVLGENDLFAIGGATLIRQWALAVGDFIAAGDLSIVMSVNHEGKRYELRESAEAAR